MRAVIISVRSDSSRLPGKCYLPIMGKPVLRHIIDRARCVDAEPVICTTYRNSDDVIASIADDAGVRCFRGSVEDKLDRWLGAVTYFGIDEFVTMDADDLFCDPELMESGFEQLERRDIGCVSVPGGMITGAFTYAVKSDYLRDVCETKQTNNTEMTRELLMGKPLWADPFFKQAMRMTLDYPEDYAFFDTAMYEMGCIRNTKPLRDIITFLITRPDIVMLNLFREYDWAMNQRRMYHG